MNGYIDALIYVVLTAISFVFLNQLISEIDPWVALVIMSGYALVLFNALNFRGLVNSYQAIIREKLIWVVMVLMLAIDWISMVFASFYSDPFVAMAALFIATAVIGFLRLYLVQRKIIYLLSFGLLLVVIGLLLVGYSTLAGKSVIIGISLGLAAGVAFYGYIASSAALATRQSLSSLAVLATRFWGVFLIALVVVKWELVLALNIRQYLQLLVVSLVPPLTYLIYIIYLGHFNLLNGIICASITTALLLPKLLLLINNRR